MDSVFDCLPATIHQEHGHNTLMSQQEMQFTVLE